MVTRIHRDIRTARTTLRAFQDALRGKWPEMPSTQEAMEFGYQPLSLAPVAALFSEGTEWEFKNSRSFADAGWLYADDAWRGLPSQHIRSRDDNGRAAPLWAFAVVQSVFIDKPTALNPARRKRALSRLFRMSVTGRASLATVYALGGRPAVRAVLLAK